MGFFTNGVVSSSTEVTLENASLYENEYGLNKVLMECIEFDREIFEESIRSDIKEIQLIREGREEEASQVFTESFKEIKDRVVEFLQKSLAKIKAFFKGIKDSVLKKLNDMKVKQFKAIVEELDKTDTSEVKVKYAEWLGDNLFTSYVEVGQLIASARNNDKLDATQAKKDVYAKLMPEVKLDDPAKFKEEFYNVAFKEAEVVPFDSIKAEVVELLSKSNYRAINETEKATVKSIEAAIKEFKKETKETDSAIIRTIQTYASTLVACASTAANTVIAANKDAVARAKKAALFAIKNGKKAKAESAEFLDAELDLLFI